jgi:hypothetical protein
MYGDAEVVNNVNMALEEGAYVNIYRAPSLNLRSATRHERFQITVPLTSSSSTKL